MADPKDFQSALQVTITPANAVGPQGANAPDLMIEYSIDGTGGWTSEQPSAEFMYFRVSTDGGITWSGPILYGTEYAAYLQSLNAKEWAEKANKWAESPENVEVETGQYSALHHKEKALDAQVAAEAARDKAVQWAENPEDVEVEAGQYSALHHKEKALDAQVAAAASATAASTSEGNALASENKAHQWAEEAEDIEVQTGEYSAYHWAKKAEAAALLAVEDQIVDGVTSKAPSQNAVYDALANKADIAYVNTELAAQIEDQIIDGITTKAASQNAIHDALVMLERKVGGGILI